MIYINISLHRTQLKSSVSIPVIFTAWSGDWAVVTVDVQFTKPKKKQIKTNKTPNVKKKKDYQKNKYIDYDTKQKTKCHD